MVYYWNLIIKFYCFIHVVLLQGTVAWTSKPGMTLEETLEWHMKVDMKKSFWGRVIYWIVFNQGIEHQEWVQVKIHRRMETSQGQSLHMPILILWIIWKIADPQTTKMKRANNQGPTDAFSSGAFLEVLATLPRWVMFLLCFSLAIRILCLATIFAAPPAPRTSRTRSLAVPRPPGGSARGAYAAYGHWAGTPSAGAPATSDHSGLSNRGAARRRKRAAGPGGKRNGES